MNITSSDADPSLEFWTDLADPSTGATRHPVRRSVTPLIPSDAVDGGGRGAVVRRGLDRLGDRR